MEVYLFVLLLVLVVGTVAIQMRKYSMLGDWKELAQRTGLGYNAGGLLRYPSLSGEIHGRSAVIDITTSRAARYSSELVRVRIGLDKALSGTVELRPETTGSGLGKAVFGSQDFAIGSERFRDTFTIKGSSFGFAEELLGDEALQETLLRLREVCAFELLMRESLLTWTTPVMLGIDQIQKVLVMLDEVAGRLKVSPNKVVFADSAEVVLYPR